MNYDLNNLKFDSPIATSAKQFSDISREIARSHQAFVESSREAAKEAAKRNATLVAGAEASIEQKELLQQQLEIIREQNALLCDNYEKLKEMYDAQVQENESAKEELKRIRRYNAWMMVIAIFAMFAAIAGPISTILVSQ